MNIIPALVRLMALNSWRDIIWTNANPIHRHIDATLGDELIHWPEEIWINFLDNQFSG